MKNLFWSILTMAAIMLSLSACDDYQVMPHSTCTQDSECPNTSVCIENSCVLQVPLTCVELGCPNGTECQDDVCVELAPPHNDCDAFQWMTTSQWYCNYTEGEPAPEPWICHLNTTDGTASDGSCNIQCAGNFWLPTQEFDIDMNASPPQLKTDYYGREFTCTQYVYIPPSATCGIAVQVPNSLSVFVQPTGNANLLWFDFVKVGPDSPECSPEIVRIEILEMDNAFGFIPNPKMQIGINNSFLVAPLANYGEADSLLPWWSKTYYQWDGVAPVGKKTTILFNCDGNCGPPSMPSNPIVLHTKLLRYWWRKNPTAPTVSGNAGAEHTIYFTPPTL